MTGNVIDGLAPTNQELNPGFAASALADIDEDGTNDTLVVITTVAGYAHVYPRSGTVQKFYFFSPGPPPRDSEWNIVYDVPGEFKINFVDVLAPGYVSNDPTTWVYKSVTAARVRAWHGGISNHNWEEDPEGLGVEQRIEAYQELNQTGLVDPLNKVDIPQWFRTEQLYQFSNPNGIKELYITTDYAECGLIDLTLYDQELPPDSWPGGKPGIVLLFDTSGSMSWRHDGTHGVPPEEQRLTLAKDAAIPLVLLLNDFAAGLAELGIARFPVGVITTVPGQPIPVFPGCSGEVITPLTEVNDAIANAAVNTIDGLTAGGNTPLLPGVGTAIGMFTEPSRNRDIVLLTDGYHNCPTTVDFHDPEVDAIINDAGNSSVKLHTIGFGCPSDVDSGILLKLAWMTGGQFEEVTDPPFDPATWDPATALEGVYGRILADALNLDLGIDPLGVISAGESFTQEFRVTQHDQTVSFYLSWATHQTGRLGLTVKSSDGATVPGSGSDIRTHEGETYKIITVKKAFLEIEGKVGESPWTIEIDSNRLDAGETEHYQYSVLVDSSLKMQPIFDAVSYTTGDTINMSVKLTKEGKPLVGVSDIQVTITRPEDGLGNWFANNIVSEPELEKIPKKVGDETLPTPFRKFRFLRDIRKVPLPGRTEPITLKLDEDEEGTYTAQFKDTAKEGAYSFLFHAAGTSRDGTPIQREVNANKYIRTKITPEGIGIGIEQVESHNGKIRRLRVLITPKDPLGNYLGPRYAGAIKVNPSWGRLVGKPQDNLDGTYSQLLEVPVTLKEVGVSVKIRGVISSVRYWSRSKIWDLFNWLTWVLLVGLIILVIVLVANLTT